MRENKLRAWSLELGACCLLLVGLCGCASSYSWRPSVPQAMRTVCVPTFRNESDVSELGAIATRQLLREIQRDGTFKIRSSGEAAVEVQGVVKEVRCSIGSYDRRTDLTLGAYEYEAIAEISVVDKRTHRVLVDNRKFTARTQFTTRQDLSTAKRDASGRLMDDMSRQIVDLMLGLNWEKERANE